MLTSAHSLDLQSRQRSQLGWHFLGVRKLQNSSRYSTLMNRKEHIWDLCDKVQRDLKLAGLPVDGFATDGTLYPTIKAMWSTELGLGGPAAQTPDTDEEGAGVGPARWYERAFDFWEDGQKCALDDDGVLGGYGHISPTDISGSAAFLDELKLMRPQLGDVKAADCGAGIGRVTKHLLLDRFESVDIVEQSPRLLRAAPKYVGLHSDRTECVCVGLQDFFPPEDSYDLFWLQWVVGHFTDADFIKVINRYRRALRKGGLVVIKDNVVPVGDGEGAFMVDSEDSTMTRSLGYFRSLFNQAGIKVVYQYRQEGFPGELVPVYMFALE